MMLTHLQKLLNAALFIREGSSSADSAYVQSGDAIAAIGTSDINFEQFSGGGSLTSGDGITISGSTVSVNKLGAGGLDFDSGALKIKLDGGTLATGNSGAKVADAGIGATQLASNSVTTAKIDSNAVTSSQIAGGAVTSAKLAANAVGASDKVADGIITAAKLAGNAVATASIAANAVTAVKLNADVAGDGLGLNAGNNAMEVKVDNTSLQITGDALSIKALGVATGMIAATSVTDDKLASNAVTSAKVAANAIIAGKIAAGAVSAVKLNADVVGKALELNSGSNALDVRYDDTTIGLSGDNLILKDDAVSTVKIQNTAVTSAKLAANAVTSAKLADAAVSTSAKLADGIVIASKLAANAVTQSAMADNSVGAGEIKFAPVFEAFTGNGSNVNFDLGGTIDPLNSDAIKVFRNGLRMKKVASSPSGQDEYTVAPTGGASGVCRVTFGTAPSNADEIYVDTLQ